MDPKARLKLKVRSTNLLKSGEVQKPKIQRQCEGLGFVNEPNIVRDFGQRNQTADQIQEVSDKGALLRAVQVRWSWDRCGSKPGRRRHGSEEQAESKSEADVGRSQADDDGDGDPGQTETVAGEGTWTTDKGRQDGHRRRTETVNTETELRLKRLGETES